MSRIVRIILSAKKKSSLLSYLLVIAGGFLVFKFRKQLFSLVKGILSGAVKKDAAATYTLNLTVK